MKMSLMKDNIIPSVKNNKEKYETYRKLFDRYKKAESGEFYLECLWIIYAMLEDRTSAFLHHLGFTSEKDRRKPSNSKNIKKAIREIFNLDEENIRYDFDKINGKINKIDEVILWSTKSNTEHTSYQMAVKKAVEIHSSNRDLEKALVYFKTTWCDKRNQLTHAFFNKDYINASLELKLLVENGMKSVRVLDNVVSQIKKQKIREKFKIR